MDKLINDEDGNVREAVAEHGYRLDKLINDEDYRVRRAVAKQRYGLDILVNDPSPDVRYKVAEQGYGLDILINDENEFVSDFAVRKWLEDHNLTIEEYIANKEYWYKKL